MKKYFYPIVFLTIFIFSCKNQEKENIIPKIPPNVPDGAVWVGGMKGGTFIDCKIIKTINRQYICDVYAETGVELLKGGKYELKYAIWNTDEKKLDYYDLNEKIQPLVYGEIYTSEIGNIELGGRLVLKPILD